MQLDFSEGSTEGLPSSLQLVPLQHGLSDAEEVSPGSLQHPLQTSHPSLSHLSPTAGWDHGTLSLLEKEREVKFKSALS